MTTATNVLDAAQVVQAIEDHLRLYPDDVLDEQQQDDLDAARATLAKAQVAA